MSETSFKDRAARRWDFGTITVDTVRRVRKELDGVNLYALVESEGGGVFQRIHADPVFACDLYYAVLRPDAEKNKIDKQTFDAAMYGDSLGEAREAFFAAVTDFFPSENHRDGLRKVIRTMTNAQKAGMANAVAIMEREAAKASAPPPDSKETPTGSPESPASPPADTPTAN